jgi:hypothetical protein
MLVEKKFIYLSLPRCASTSFLITCLRKNIKFEHADSFYLGIPKTVDLSLDNERLADQLLHGHETIVDLKYKFGLQYPIVGIKRQRHERFLSLWKHLIDLTETLESHYHKDVSNILRGLNSEDVLFYKSEDLIRENKSDLVRDAKKRFGLEKYINDRNWIHFRTILFITMNPSSYYHNNDPGIIWFDYENMGVFEKWVGDKLGIEFNLEKSNSSIKFKTGIDNDGGFVERYNRIYDYFDLPKKNISLL